MGSAPDVTPAPLCPPFCSLPAAAETAAAVTSVDPHHALFDETAVDDPPVVPDNSDQTAIAVATEPLNQNPPPLQLLLQPSPRRSGIRLVILRGINPVEPHLLNAPSAAHQQRVPVDHPADNSRKVLPRRKAGTRLFWNEEEQETEQKRERKQEKNSKRISSPAWQRLPATHVKNLCAESRNSVFWKKATPFHLSDNSLNSCFLSILTLK